jgi:hypothetical protein
MNDLIDSYGRYSKKSWYKIILELAIGAVLWVFVIPTILVMVYCIFKFMFSWS